MRAIHITYVVALFLALFATSPMAQVDSDRASKGGIFSLLPPDSVTQHTLTVGDERLLYTATAGTIDLLDQNGERSAKVFYTGYVANGQRSDRPLTFVFNGGPGAASAYLHLGLVGPRILEFESNDGTRPSLHDNPQSWLSFTDLVLIDPVGTGWSRTAGNDGKNFSGVRQDAESIAKFIALYTHKNGRLLSRKFLLGESYGGFRAAKVASALKDTQGILIFGIVMVSPMIEGRFLGNSDDPLTEALRLPSLAAAELERRRAFDPAVLQAAERFAITDYLVALAGPPLQSGAADAFYARVSALAGIPQRQVSRTRGFIGDIYAKHAAGDGLIVSPYDAGTSSADAYPESPVSQNDDPVLDGYTRAYGAAFAAYAKTELGFETSMTYILLSDDVNRKWEWNGNRGSDGRMSASAATDIRDLLSVIPQFRMMVAHGYSDTLTPYGVSRYVLDHLPQTLSDKRVALILYPGGHMFYTRSTSRTAFSTDIKSFYQAP